MFQHCSECDKDTSWGVNRDGFSCCLDCGLVDDHYVHLVSAPSDHEKFIDVSPLWSSKGRYKPIFHWNERVAQLCCADPELPDKVIERIWFDVFDGHQGAPENFTRADVMMILKRLRLRKYKEKWKKILSMLNPNFDVLLPTSNFRERIEGAYMAVETRFFELKRLMPKSVIRKANGEVRIQDRHSNLPFNYLFRKICEALDIWDWHDELPLLRSASKLHNLDDITSVIFKMIGLKFRRSVVVKRPKTRKSRTKHKKRTKSI